MHDDSISAVGVDRAVPTRCDVLVIGSGAAGLAAALAAAVAGCRVTVLEQAALLGGTTALSGGTCWIPDNHLMKSAGVADSREDALAYMNSLSFGLLDDSLVEAFVDHAPKVIPWIEKMTGLTFGTVHGYPDYHPERSGGKPSGGRSLDPGLFSFHQLGTHADLVAPPPRNVHLTLEDVPLGGGTGRLEPQVLSYRQESDLRGCGQALVGGLLTACLQQDVQIVTEAAASDLMRDSCGRIVGVQVRYEGEERVWHASRGVVLASGGFEWDRELVRDFLRGPMDSPASMPTCTGDGLRMAMKQGAALGNMREAWWVPTVRIPGDAAFGREKSTPINRERTLPHSIFVNRRGKRFVNEATNYNAMGAAFHHIDAASYDYVNLPAWLVFDQSYVDKYGLFETPPGGEMPSWIKRAQTLEELGRSVGINSDGLRDTVGEWNRAVRNLRDVEFARGESSYDRWAGDREFRGQRESTLGPIERAPYYAVQVRSGTLGTKGGPRTTANAQVVDVHGTPIRGLYAAGNVMAGVSGMFYGGAGGTLGPALTFGFLAGDHAARAASEEIREPATV